jgi:hypothetical protein
VVVPVDPFQGGQFDVVEAFPGAAVVDEFGFEQAALGFGQGVVPGGRRPSTTVPSGRPEGARPPGRAQRAGPARGASKTPSSATSAPP